MQGNKRLSAYRYPSSTADGFPVLLIAALLHGAALYAILHHPPAATRTTEPFPIMVSLVARPARPAEPKASQQAPAEAMPERRPKPVREPHPEKKRVPAKLNIPVERRAPDALVAAPRELPQEAMVPLASTPPRPVVAASVPPGYAVARAPSPPAGLRSSADEAPAPPSYNADYLQNPAPRYPPLARRMGQQGKVVLRVLVSAAGAAAEIEVRSSSGWELLDEAALDAVKRWRFVPARKGDRAVSAWVLIPITFNLQG